MNTSFGEGKTPLWDIALGENLALLKNSNNPDQQIFMVVFSPEDDPKMTRENLSNNYHNIQNLNMFSLIRGTSDAQKLPFSMLAQ